MGQMRAECAGITANWAVDNCTRMQKTGVECRATSSRRRINVTRTIMYVHTRHRAFTNKSTSHTRCRVPPRVHLTHNHNKPASVVKPTCNNANVLQRLWTYIMTITTTTKIIMILLLLIITGHSLERVQVWAAHVFSRGRHLPLVFRARFRIFRHRMSA